MSASFGLGFQAGTYSPCPLQPAGCLAAWQARRVRLYIDANLMKHLDICALAQVVNLSPSYFSRAFKRTLGVTVHRYVMKRRVEKAQQLMLTTAEALSGIALSCGMSDQSHLTRWFRRIVGETPAVWRRARYEPSTLTNEGA
jgi:AraC family transcriptional regulator